MEKYIGIITKDATTKTIEGDRTVTNFTIAKNRYYTGKDGQRNQRTTFIECADWRNTGVIPHLLKGKLVEVMGETGVRAYLDKDGHPVGVLTLTVGQIILHSSRNANGQPEPRGEQDHTGTPDHQPVAETADDLPF
jgi:single-strand DNA-binding protein